MHRVLSRPRYLVLAASVSLVTFLGIIWYPMLTLLTHILLDTSIALDRAVVFGAQILLSSLIDAPRFTLTYVFVAAILIGINVALLAFYLRWYRRAPSSLAATSGIFGGLVAILGFGCAACGSVFLVSFIASIGGIGLLSLLPYQGEEIGFIGMLFLLFSIVVLARAINKPAVCPI